MATTLNPFDLLGDDEGEDPAQLLAKAAALAQKAEAKKSAPAAAAAGKPAAKLPTKPAPPAQAGKSRFQVYLRVASMPDLGFRVYGGTGFPPE
jgi:hypothetical protein